MQIAHVLVGGRRVGPGESVFVIAEAGVNHNGDLAVALRLIDRAAEAGADAVKFQTFQTAALATPDAPKADYQICQTGGGSQTEMLRKMELSREAHMELRHHAVSHGLVFLSTPFDSASVDLLDELEVPAFKVSSGDLTNWPLLRHIGGKGKPVLLSTGMAYLSEVDEALRQLSESGCEEIVILHCLSNYPADPRDVNLRAIRTLWHAFQRPVGYSDHTLGTEAVLGAVALGACVIEKHLTLDNSMPGPDHTSSLNPVEFRDLVVSVRKLELALGDGRKRASASEGDTRRLVRRSLAATKDLEAGTTLQSDMLAALRPGTGLPVTMLDAVAGRKLKRGVRQFELLAWTDLE